MQRPTTNTISPGPLCDKEEQIAFVYIPLMTKTEVSHNSGIPASEDNPASSVQADGSGNKSPAQAGCKP